jgi:integrase
MLQVADSEARTVRIKADSTIRKLPPTDRRLEHPDDRVTGLYLVQQESGALSWAVRYRAHGAPKKFTLGPYPAVDLATARRRAQEAIGRVAGGEDPAATKQASRAAVRAARAADADRIDYVVAQFIERHAKIKTRDWRNTERMLTVDVVGRWGGKRLSQITRADVHAMLDAIAIDREKPIQANRVFAQFRKLCGWAVSKGIIEKSPCEGVAAPSSETRRDRHLSDDEIRLAWRAFGKVGWPFGPVAKLLLLTGMRRDEVGEGRWSEIDLVARTWTLPASRTKNKRTHAVSLSDAAAHVLLALPRIGDKPDGFIFTTTGRTPISGWSRAKLAIDKATGAFVEPWTFHDLRRTVATNLQKLGVKLEVTEAVLNHVSGSRAGVVGIYQRHDWADEKRAALTQWAARVTVIVGDE